MSRNVDKLFEMMGQEVSMASQSMKPVKKPCSSLSFIKAESDMLNAFSNFLTSFKRIRYEYDPILRKEVEVYFTPEQKVKLRKEVMEKMDLVDEYINKAFGSEEYEVKAIKQPYDDEEDDYDDDDDYDDGDDY